MTIQSNAEQWEDGTFKTFAQLRLEDENAALRKRLETAEKENVYLRANMPMSVLRRLKEQAAIAGEEKP